MLDFVSFTLPPDSLTRTSDGLAPNSSPHRACVSSWPSTYILTGWLIVAQQRAKAAMPLKSEIDSTENSDPPAATMTP